MYFVFDGGEVGPDVDITLQEEELDDYRFTETGEFGSYLPPMANARVSAALHARAIGAPVYLPTWAG